MVKDHPTPLDFPLTISWEYVLVISLDRFRILLLRQRAALCFRVFCQALEAPADVVAAEAVIIEASGVLPVFSTDSTLQLLVELVTRASFSI